MPRFFFNLREGDVLISDPEGSILPDIETARDVARQTAREMLVSRLEDHKEVNGGIIEIADPEGRIVDRIALADVLKNSGG
jgi:hypothetical protein